MPPVAPATTRPPPRNTQSWTRGSKAYRKQNRSNIGPASEAAAKESDAANQRNRDCDCSFDELIEKEEAKGDACAYLEGAPPYDPSPPPPPTTEEELAAEDEASAAGPCAACGKDPRVPRFKVDAPEAPSWRTS